MPSVRAQYGALVRHHRERRGLTQAVLAERTDRSLELIGRIERGAAAPSLETIEAIARALKTPIRDFFGVGEFAVTSEAAPLASLVRRLAMLPVTELAWVDRLLTAAMAKPK
jgi:transcriptional regulator with XRE-family HTH domain